MTWQKQLIATKYAKAFLNVFIGDLSLSDYRRIVGLEQFLKDRRDVLAFLALPHIEPSAKHEALASVIEKFSLPTCFNRLVIVLVEGKRSFLFPLILYFVARFYRRRKGIEDFMIKSSSYLNADALKTIEQFLARKTGRQVLSEYDIDKSLIAGIRLKSDDYLWEYSVAKKLRTLMISPMK